MIKNRKMMIKNEYMKPIVKMMAIDDEELLAGSTKLEIGDDGNPYQDLGGAGETSETGGNLGKHFNAWDTWEEEVF